MSDANDFANAGHTVIVSDIHLSDAEPVNPKSPLWKRFKRAEHFIDEPFAAFLQHVQRGAAESGNQGPIELVLNGDIFDFDSVMGIPKEHNFKVSLLERLRGLAAEEPKSRYKIGVILEHHPVWLKAIRDFVLSGNRVIFVIGNHDMELHWPSVREDLRDALKIPDEARARVRFCEWFYVSNRDTLIEHGNQYDAYCLCSNPINPLIRKRTHTYVRLPFGNLAGKYMTNGMGLMNPHADTAVKDSSWEYLQFYFRYSLRTQPFLLFTWFWSAMATLIYSITEGLLPPMTDPLTVDARVADIAQRANASPSVVWSLRELHVHPAIYNPVKILRELWLDRALFFAAIFFVGYQFFSFLHIFTPVSLWWFAVPVVVLMPLFIFYARSVHSDVGATQGEAARIAPLSARIAQVHRVAQGHTHLEQHTQIGGVDVINTGTWSPAYADIECTKRYGRRCFAWIRPGPDGERTSALYEWRDTEAALIEMK